MLIDPEKIVARMLMIGEEVLSEAITHVEQTLKTHIIGFVGAFSGGDDSIVATHFANRVRPDCVTFNADTMIGLGPARRHIDAVIKAHKWTAEIERATAEGPPAATETNAEVIGNWRDGSTAYEEAVLNHGFGGPPQHPIMYRRLKERQLMKLRRKLQGGKRGGRLIVMSGVRHDESAIRAGYKQAWRDEPKSGVVWVNPFYEFTKLDFEVYRQEFGLVRNPVKRLCGISGECCCGTFGSKDERLAYRQADPAFADYLDALEKRVRERFPWSWGEGPPAWWQEQQRGQGMMFPMLPDEEMPTFQPMCVGCNNGRR